MSAGKVVLIHGFNLKDGGAKTTDQLENFIGAAGYDVDIDEADYGFWSLWQILWLKGKARTAVIYRIARAIEKADIIIGHSNGANFGTQALEILPEEFRNTKKVIWISGALDTKTPIPASVESLLVLYTPHDFWVKLSTYLPLNPWGRMGARGYLGGNPKANNLMDDSVKRHSDWFKKRHLRQTWNYIYDFVKEKIK